VLSHPRNDPHQGDGGTPDPGAVGSGDF